MVVVRATRYSDGHVATKAANPITITASAATIFKSM
jgi:hypothetical protein